MSDPEKKEVDPPAVDSPAEANGNGDEKKKYVILATSLFDTKSAGSDVI